MSNVSTKRAVLAWALYDWANSAFATTVMAGFFPVFFKEYWSSGTDVTVSTFQLGAANSLASIVVAVLAPLLGAVADRGRFRKRFLLLFALLGIVMTAGLAAVEHGEWQIAAALYVLAAIGFSGSIIFYDSLLVTVADPATMDSVSSLGYALGYLGGGLLFALNVAMTLFPQAFGLSGAAEAIRLSFLSVALWWTLFSIPLFLGVREHRAVSALSPASAVREGWKQLRQTFAAVRRLRVVFVFLVGYWLYIDGVDTIVRMAVDYGMSLGFRSQSLIVALLITQFVGFPAALAFGWVGRKWGAKRGIFICLGVYLGVTLWGYGMDRESEFFVLAAVIGLVQGGIQALSRSLYTRLIPPGQSAEFFGFYNLLGKFAAVAGPLLMGWAALLTGNPRSSILSISVLFVLGGVMLARVDEKEGQRLAAELGESENPF